jgi:hypothetical protein
MVCLIRQFRSVLEKVRTRFFIQLTEKEKEEVDRKIQEKLEELKKKKMTHTEAKAFLEELRRTPEWGRLELWLAEEIRKLRAKKKEKDEEEKEKIEEKLQNSKEKETEKKKKKKIVTYAS